MKIKHFTAAFIILLMHAGSICRSFNVDTQFPYIFNGSKNSYFGYTVALNKNSRGPVVLIGAPKANSSTLREKIIEPGALFRCDVSRPKEPCREISILKEGNNFTSNLVLEKKDGMWLGVSLDVRQSATQNDVVVCGHLWKNMIHRRNRYVNGVCYIIDADLNENSVGKLLPFVDLYRQTILDFGHTKLGFYCAQAGMSAVYSEDTSNLILGAPGYMNWRGGVANYPIYRSRGKSMYKKFEIPEPPSEIEYNAYFGYSVTSGKFFESGTLQYAVGAPRDSEHYGKVYIIGGGESSRIDIQARKRGFQLGEYFGASVLGIDLNGDTFSELIVGAPLHSADFGGDEGKVYVYIRDGKDLRKQTEVEGDRKPGARFGTAIANIGDVNQDGYADIAVGAPYEDGRGAVYIYHGRQYGLDSLYVQKIEASSVDGRLSGFGIHVARGLDVDGNGYPDILVGSYASAQAVLFRSRPIIEVYPRLSFNPKQIVMNVPCENSLTNLTCVQINACISYRGVYVPPTLDFKLSVFIQDPRDRGFFEEGNSRNVKSTMSISASVRREECFGFRMFLKAGIKDVITPVQVRFSHELKTKARVQRSLDKTFPVYHPYSLTSVTSQLPFQTGCDKTDECLSNLNVSAVRTDSHKNLRFITLGDMRSISVEITVQNNGEPAYLTELYIYLPPGLSTISHGICERAAQQHNASLVCDIGNPLRNGSQEKIQIKVDLLNIPPQTKYLAIDLEVVTASTETDFADNTATIPFYFQSIFDIGVTGTSSPDQIMYDGSGTLENIITHTYIVRKYGRSSLKTIYFELDVPNGVRTSDGIESVLYFTGIDTEQKTPASVPVSCDFSTLTITSIETNSRKQGGIENEDGILNIEEDANSTSTRSPGNLVKRSVDETDEQISEVIQKKEVDNNVEENSPKIDINRISCDNKDFQCVRLQCTASSFYSEVNYAEISVSFQVNFEVLNKFLGQWYHLQLITSSSIKTETSDDINKNTYPDTAQVETDILHEGPPPPGKVESWVIFVSIGVGNLILIIIFIILIKVGFFKRKEKDKMKKLIRESKREKRTDDNAAIKEEVEVEVAE